jgi:hypothetical protein
LRNAPPDMGFNLFGVEGVEDEHTSTIDFRVPL